MGVAVADGSTYKTRVALWTRTLHAMDTVDAVLDVANLHVEADTRHSNV